MTMKPYSQAYQEINAAIEYLEQDERLCMADNFIERIKAIDFLELQMMNEPEQEHNGTATDAERLSLVQRAAALKQRLDDANETLFAHLLAGIQSNDRSTLKQYIAKAEQQTAAGADEGYLGYDEMDSLVTGLLDVAVVPEEPPQRDPDMIYYQPTPARIILKLINQLNLTRDDVFYDLGSGLGHVPILVNLLADIKTKGVELEESYFHYSTASLKKLRLSQVEFMNADARHVAYDDGTIFYMYTPFQGEVLRQVLEKLEAQSKQRQIRICTYGTCTLQVSKQNWLRSIYRTGTGEGSLSIFVSL
jgi:hypothetical protein